MMTHLHLNKKKVKTPLASNFAYLFRFRRKRENSQSREKTASQTELTVSPSGNIVMRVRVIEKYGLQLQRQLYNKTPWKKDKCQRPECVPCAGRGMYVTGLYLAGLNCY